MVWIVRYIAGCISVYFDLIGDSKMLIRKAERKKAKLRMALCGVSGSGKTRGAIKIAEGLGGKTVFIDTENGSADLYCDLGNFDVLELHAPFSTDRYIEAIVECEKSGYDNIIIDSLSHAWAGTGGILDMHSKSRNKNSYMAWGEVTPKHNSLIDAILRSKCHVIACMRSKAQHEVVKDSNNRAVPVKIGLAPVQRDGMDYEFTSVLDIDRDTHFYTASKDRTNIFEGKTGLIDESIGEKLKEWLEKGKSKTEVIEGFLQRFKSDIDEVTDLVQLKDCFSKVYSEAKSSGFCESDIRLIIAEKDKKKQFIDAKLMEDDVVM